MHCDWKERAEEAVRTAGRTKRNQMKAKVKTEVTHHRLNQEPNSQWGEHTINWTTGIIKLGN